MKHDVLKCNRAKILRTSRESLGLTQEEVAKRINVAKQTYLKWENGDTEPKATQIALLAKELKLTADEICNGVIFKRYNLDDFIIEQTISQAPENIITLRTWQFIHDQKGFIDSLRTRDLESRKVDLEDSIKNYESLKRMGLQLSEDDEKKFAEAVKAEKEEIKELERKL